VRFASLTFQSDGGFCYVLHRSTLRIGKFKRQSSLNACIIAKLGVVAEEADETEHWLDVIRSSGLAKGAELEWLYSESRELRAIFVQSVKTARRNHGGTPRKSRNP